MSDKSEEKPDAVGGVEGESDVIAERSGAGTPRSRRPVPADLPAEVDQQEDDQQEDDLHEEGAGEDEENGDDVVRPDAGPTG
ncbi:hypothetical protein [Nonomuraea sp. B5E05]|uniref:hypothetical protein n=1 Tax=Nonomuraea sp. B5E05 TaxID=3153569 RepID=UPI003260DFF3